LETHDKIAGVVFDWDGVLLDSLGASYNVYNKIFERVGTKRLSMDEFLTLQSPNWYEFYVKVGVPKDRWNEVDAEWVRLYKEEAPRLHSDALTCLSELNGAGFKLAIVTNGSKARVEGELAKFGLAQYFGSVLCGEKREELKPSPIMIERTLRVLGVGPREAVYVGDAPADIQASKSAGVPSIALARERILVERLKLENPDQVFGGLDDVAAFVLGRR